MKATERVALGWCQPGVVDARFMNSIIDLYVARVHRLDSRVDIEGSALVSKMRNEVVSKFLDASRADWLLMIDTDEILSLHAFDRLIDAADVEKRPIVSGLVFASFAGDGIYPTPVPTIFKAADEGGWRPINHYPANRVIEVDAAGTGCLLVHRRVLEDMRLNASVDEGKDWCWFQTGPVNGNWVGEDHVFCAKARHLGYPIHADTGAILPHRKRYWLDDIHHKQNLAAARTQPRE